MPSLTSIPVELVAHIGEATDPSSHLQLSLTCKYVAAAMKDILERHRLGYQQKTCSDIQPGDILNTLRLVLKDPVAAHHVRSVHIWCTRLSWEDWRPLKIDDEHAVDDIFMQTAPVRPYLTAIEVERYLTRMSQHLPEFDEGSELREQARDELAGGREEFLKALLMLECPRLQNVYCARRRCKGLLEDGALGNSSLGWLCNVVMAHAELDREDSSDDEDDENDEDYEDEEEEEDSELEEYETYDESKEFDEDVDFVPDEGFNSYGDNYDESEDEEANTDQAEDEFRPQVSHWPAALLSLRHIAVGIETRALVDFQDWQYHDAPIAKLMNLPNLESLYYRSLVDDDWTDYQVSDDRSHADCLSENCSKLRHIFIDEVSSLGMDMWKNIVNACKSQLTSVAFRNGESEDSDAYVRIVRSAPNLQSIMFYNDGSARLSGYRCGTFLPEHLGGYDGTVRMVSLTSSDVPLQAINPCGPETKYKHLSVRERFVKWMVEGQDGPLFPQTVETIVLSGGLSAMIIFIGRANQSTLAEMVDWFDEALAALISTRKGDETGNVKANDRPYIYPNLKAIYIEPFGRWEDVEQRGATLWMQRSVAAAAERGIHLRSRLNKYTLGHSPVDFHMAPDKYDMRLDLTPPENEVFDPQSGDWQTRGCEACGSCPSCFALFPREVWAGVDRNPPEKSVDTIMRDFEEPANNKDQVWTRAVEKSESGAEVCWYVQSREEYEKDRTCPAVRVTERPVGPAPPIGFPMTRRKLLSMGRNA